MTCVLEQIYDPDDEDKTIGYNVACFQTESEVKMPDFPAPLHCPYCGVRLDVGTPKEGPHQNEDVVENSSDRGGKR